VQGTHPFVPSKEGTSQGRTPRQSEAATPAKQGQYRKVIILLDKELPKGYGGGGSLTMGKKADSGKSEGERH